MGLMYFFGIELLREEKNENVYAIQCFYLFNLVQHYIFHLAA